MHLVLESKYVDSIVVSLCFVFRDLPHLNIHGPLLYIILTVYIIHLLSMSTIIIGDYINSNNQFKTIE